MCCITRAVETPLPLRSSSDVGWCTPPLSITGVSTARLFVGCGVIDSDWEVLVAHIYKYACSSHEDSAPSKESQKLANFLPRESRTVNADEAVFAMMSESPVTSRN